jgi:catechol 2,3-dioxygenase
MASPASARAVIRFVQNQTMDPGESAHRDRPYGLRPEGFRLPDEARLGPVRLLVGDIGRSLDYYERLIGLRALARGDRQVVLAPIDDDRALVILETAPGVQPARRGAYGLFHFAILVPDRATLGRFAAHALRLHAPMGSADHLVSEALYLHDPDGLGIEIYADRPRETWQHRDRELSMATDPLDLRDLVAAGGHDAWTGMPRGTVMGHVHLHVGDLDAADAFYRGGLGFDLMVWSYPGARFFAAGGYHHHLGTNTWADGPSPEPDRARLLEWTLVLPDAAGVAAAVASLRQAGAEVDAAGSSTAARDRWGTRVRIAAGPQGVAG